MPRRTHSPPALLAIAVMSWGCKHPAVERATSDPAPSSETSSTSRTTICENATCFEAQAQRALEDGRLDVASAHLLDAFERDREPERLNAYLSRLETNGQTRALAAALDRNAKTFPGVVTPYRERAGAAVADSPTQLTGPQPGFTQALAASRARDFDAALGALEGNEHPAARALRGRVYTELGATTKSRSAYARARIAIDERGASMRLGPYETGLVTAIAYVDEHPVRITGWRPRVITEPVGVSRLEFLGEAEVVDKRMLPVAGGIVAGDRLYARRRGGGHNLTVFDLRSGTELGAIEAPIDAQHAFAVIDEGPKRRFLITPIDQQVTLYSIPEELGADAKLETLGTFSYGGTTPTITRVYTGNGAEHGNILNDTLSWPVSFAVSPGLDRFAYGTSDSVVHLHKMNSTQGKSLTVKWEYVERRMGGANADRNNPIDLSFSKAGLVAVYGRGDVVTFSMDGKRLAWRKGECSADAVRKYAARYRAATPTKEDRAACGRLQAAKLSAAGERVAGTGPFDLRVIPRSRSGEELEAYLGTKLGAHVMTWASETRVIFGNLYGQVWEWSEGKPVRSLTEKRDGMSVGPRQPRLSGDLRVLQWGGDYRPLVAWDLWTGKRLREDAARPSVQAGSHAAYTIEREGPGTIVRDATGAQAYPFESGSCEQATFLNDEGSRLLATNGTKAWFVDLERGTQRELKIGDHDLARPPEDLALSADGQRLAIYAENAVINVYDTKSGKRLKRISAKAGEYHRAMAIAPDGSWVAWQEQLPRPGRGLPNVTVHVAGLTTGVKDRETTVAGWTKALVAHPTASELLLVTENSFTRWDPRTGEVTPEELSPVGANTLHYSDDGKLIIVEQYNRVDIHANAPGLPVLARLHVLSDDQWFVETGSGSVDGSAGARDSLATIVEGPLDTSVLPGDVAWDRFVVPGLMADATRYLEALPPEPAEMPPR